MNTTNEKRYAMIAEIRSDMSTLKTEVISEMAGIKAAQSELRADMSQWALHYSSGASLQ